MRRQLNITHGELATKRMQLVPLSLNHLEEIFKIYADYDVIHFTDSNLQFNIDDSRKFMNSVLERFESKDALHWGIQLPESSKIIGTVALYHID